MGHREHYGLFILGLIYLTAVNSQASQPKVTPIAYKVIKSDETSSRNVVLENAKKYKEIIKNTAGDILIFPEYGLMAKVVEAVGNPLNHYSVIIPKIKTNLCEMMNATSNNQKALKEIGCAAKNYNKHVIFSVLEGPWEYSTIIHVDKDGVMRNVYRKDVPVFDLSIRPFKENTFNIDGTDYWISMSYDPFTRWEPHWKNIIHFSSQLKFQFYVSDLIAAFFHSKQDKLMVYSPTMVICNLHIDFCPPQNAYVINKGKVNNPIINELPIYFKEERIYLIIPLKNNKAQRGECKVEIKSRDDAISKSYNLLYFETNKFIGRNVSICALVHNGVFSDNNEAFQQILISNKKSILAVPFALNHNFSLIENYNWDNNDTLELSGESLKEVRNIGIVSEISGIPYENDELMKYWPDYYNDYYNEGGYTSKSTSTEMTTKSMNNNWLLKNITNRNHESTYEPNIIKTIISRPISKIINTHNETTNLPQRKTDSGNCEETDKSKIKIQIEIEI